MTEKENSQAWWSCDLGMPFGEMALQIQLGLLNMEELILP